MERPDGVASHDVTDGSDDVLHETDGETAQTAAGATPDEPVAAAEPPGIDLSRIDHDLAGVEAALRRLDDGSYWTDEITGDPLDEALLVADPVARRNR